MKELDQKNRKLLYLLSLNSRTPTVQLAKMIGLSKDAVANRIEQLEKKGVIQGYPSIINFKKLGYDVIRVHIKLLDCTVKEEHQIIDYLISIPEVLFVQQTEGNWDLAFGVRVKSISEFTTTWYALMQLHKSKIGSYRTAIYEEIKQHPRKYLYRPQKTQTTTKSMEQNTREKLQENDMLILKKLSVDARKSAVQIAQELSMPVTTVVHKIKKLHRVGVIESHTIIIDIKKIDCIHLKLELTIKKIEAIKQIKSIIADSPYAIHHITTIGGSDIEILFEVPTMEEFHKEVDKIRELTGAIREWNYTSLTQYYKFTYF